MGRQRRTWRRQAIGMQGMANARMMDEGDDRKQVGLLLSSHGCCASDRVVLTDLYLCPSPQLSPSCCCQLFARHCSGQLSSHPWSEYVDASLGPASASIRQLLVAANQAGLLTINSLPAVNAAPSDSPDIGERGRGGDGQSIFFLLVLMFSCWFSPSSPLLGQQCR